MGVLLRWHSRCGWVVTDGWGVGGFSFRILILISLALAFPAGLAGVVLCNSANRLGWPGDGVGCWVLLLLLGLIMGGGGFYILHQGGGVLSKV